MSTATYAVLEDAVRAHVADETDGGYATAWHIVAAAVSPDSPDETHYQYVTHDGAPHEWIGLLWMAQRRAMRWEADEGD